MENKPDWMHQTRKLERQMSLARGATYKNYISEVPGKRCNIQKLHIRSPWQEVQQTETTYYNLFLENREDSTALDSR